MPVKLNKIPEGSPELAPVAKAEIEDMQRYYQSSLPHPGSDAISGWVSRTEIEALLKDNEINGIVPNGIRILYGKHRKSTHSSAGYEYKDKHTVILVATYDSNVANPQPETSTNLLTETTSSSQEANSVSYTSSYNGMGGDTIPLCPPRC